MAKLEKEKVRSEHYYSVGYSNSLQKYVMAICITSISYYNDYYEISEEEYNMFGTKELDDLSYSLVNQTSSSPRFLYSEKSGGDKEIYKKFFQKWIKLKFSNNSLNLYNYNIQYEFNLIILFCLLNVTFKLKKLKHNKI